MDIVFLFVLCCVFVAIGGVVASRTRTTFFAASFIFAASYIVFSGGDFCVGRGSY
ncbi:hypothetical protein ACU8XX_22390 [Escherichia sp. MAL-1]